MSSPAANPTPPGAGRAHRQLAIFGELLRSILHAARHESAFPSFLQQRLGRDRRFGSRDRRLYRALAYSAVRHLVWLEKTPAEDRPLVALWLAGDEPVITGLRELLLADWPQLPPSLAERATLLSARYDKGFSADSLFPEWLSAEAPTLTGAERDVLLTRPPLWLRMQGAAAQHVDDWLRSEGIPVRSTADLPDARAILAETDLSHSPLHESGAFEIQDLGSQLILHLAAPIPGTRWLDACAGAGGKTLQLAQLLGPTGHVDATDIRPAALAELRQRATRAGLANIATLDQPPAPETRYDGVLVDAPCSGSGTWRRHPHLRWQTSTADLRRHHQRQTEILFDQADYVRPGGRLVYATCSLARTENEDTVSAFLAAHPQFRVVAPARTFACPANELGTTIPPHVHDSDGFFVSVLERSPE